MKKVAKTAPVAQVTLGEFANDQRFNPDHAENIALGNHARTINAAVKRALARLGTYEEVAAKLDAILGPDGQHVSASTLRATFDDNAAETRNHTRLSWLVLVLGDPEVQGALQPRTYTAEERWEITREYLATEAPGVLRGLMSKLGRVP